MLTDPDLAAEDTRTVAPAAHDPVVILGGGINGAGLFRNLSLQGVSWLLIDRGDFYAGPSAGPSRLIQWGNQISGKLLSRDGSRATLVAAWCAERQDTPLVTLPDYSREQIAFIVTNECARRLSDVLFRRTDIALSGRLKVEVGREVASIVHRISGWSEARLARELAELKAVAGRHHGLSLNFTSAFDGKNMAFG